MNTLGFTAEASLYRTRQKYRASSSLQPSHSVMPAYGPSSSATLRVMIA